MNSRQSIGSTEQYNDELQEAGVTPLQWNGICKLARLEQDDASIEKVKKKNSFFFFFFPTKQKVQK